MNVSECIDLNSNATSSKSPWNLPVTVILSIVSIILMVCIIVGNFLVITVILRHKGMRTRTNLFLLNLAIADLLVGMLMAPFTLITIISGRWIFGERFCNVNGFMNALCYITSCHTLMYISVHKYFSITRPFSRFITISRIFIMVIAAWTWAIFCATMTITGLTSVCFKYGTSQCGPLYPNDKESYIHHTIIQVTVILIPLSVMGFTYISMYREIRAHTKRLQQNTRLRKDTILAQQKKVIFTLFIVLACFILCWMPYHIYSMYVSLNKATGNFNTIMNPIVYLFAYLNSACNPIIYALRSEAFRKGYQEILCMKKEVIFSEGMLRKNSLSANSKVNIPDAVRQEDIPVEANRSFSIPYLWTRGIGLDTIHENSSPHMFRLFNSLKTAGNGSKPRQGSVASIQSINSIPVNQINFKGSSVIKKDGSVVIMKDGKIVCVRQNPSHKKLSDSSNSSSFEEKRPSLASIPSGSAFKFNIGDFSTLDEYSEEIDDSDSLNTSDSYGQLKDAQHNKKFSLDSIGENESEDQVFICPDAEQDSYRESSGRQRLRFNIDEDMSQTNHDGGDRDSGSLREAISQSLSSENTAPDSTTSNGYLH
ncbi:histamine H2 receptor-like isoform X1 [Octopus sinensis]|uniref:Histamine H2 receptor-like isoform X1 n=1 Tax=Octopus sinensis TaxID=2607531 RepID=A0A6P7T4Y7_9MOLL|nr:histamine H2 receptor-like isoform X1 [Octopus sinensis]XP_029645827.1 histamine H2 receptor-like isoform X1 [Octopus sinensis]XP_029645828.1 histamine H2 receptor-like isoform X1 [Octopus sinensis]XP_029645829.1 histamine H2 receptor-like isoform X1 [Octopus sinensis]XP_036365689.1 histamine H2 receptor-like isoform X1 [Octopus sinensis]